MYIRLLRMFLAAAIALAIAAPVYAQDSVEIPAPYCGDLTPEDCAIIEASAVAMSAVRSYAFDFEYAMRLEGVPELPADPLAISYGMDGLWAIDESGYEAIAQMSALQAMPSLDAMSDLAERMPALMADMYRGMQFDGTLMMNMSPEIAAEISAESDVPFPEELSFGMRMVDGMAYINLADFKALAPEELEDLPSDWLGVDLAGLMERNMEDAMLSGEMVGGENLAAGLVVGAGITSLTQAFEPFMNIERLDDVSIGDQSAAVFRTSVDLIGFFSSQAFRDFVMQIMSMVPSESGDSLTSQDMQDIEEGLTMLGLLAPMLFQGLDANSETMIGLDDFYAYDNTLHLSWDLTSLLQFAAMSDPELGAQLLPGQSSIIEFGFDSTFDQFNEEFTVEAPEDVEIIPLDMMVPTDTSALF